MKSTTNSPRDIPKKRIKWPYSYEETTQIFNWIYDELKVLSKNDKNWADYALLFQKIIFNIESFTYAPELTQYLVWWKVRFSDAKNQNERNKILVEFFSDLQIKWFIPRNIKKVNRRIWDLIAIASKQDTIQ